MDTQRKMVNYVTYYHVCCIMHLSYRALLWIHEERWWIMSRRSEVFLAHLDPSHMNESCHIWMSRVTHEWVMSHMNESCHTWMSHVSHEWVMSHMNESCHTWMSHVTHDWAMSHMTEPCHTWLSHVTHECVMLHMNESCHTWMSHVTHEWVMSHINASCHTWLHEVIREWVIQSWHTRMSRKWVMPHRNEAQVKPVSLTSPEASGRKVAEELVHNSGMVQHQYQPSNYVLWAPY